MIVRTPEEKARHAKYERDARARKKAYFEDNKECVPVLCQGHWTSKSYSL